MQQCHLAREPLEGALRRGRPFAHFQFLLCIISLSPLFTGCISTGSPELRDKEILSQIRPGVSTKDDVRLLLGLPRQVVRIPQRAAKADTSASNPETVETWIYVYTDENPGLVFRDANFKTGSVFISFDAQDVVRDIDTSQTDHLEGTEPVDDVDAATAPAK